MGVVAVFAALFKMHGFSTPPKPETYWTSLLYALGSTLSLSDAATLTSWGQLLQALLRLTGPVLLGLALTSAPRPRQAVKKSLPAHRQVRQAP